MKHPLVLHLVLALNAGGLEKLVVEWTNARNRLYPGSTFILCLDAPGAMADQVEGEVLQCVHARRSRFPWDRVAVQSIRRAIAQQRAAMNGAPGAAAPTLKAGTCHAACGPVILHSHNLAAWQYAVLVGSPGGIKRVHTQHGANLHDAGHLNRWRMRWLASRTEVLLAVSTGTAEALAVQAGLPRERIRVIPNGIAPSALSSLSEVQALGIKEQFGIPADAPVIGSVGRLDRVKGCERLLYAFARMRPAADSVPSYLFLIGDGPERKALERLATELGIQERVVFAGLRSDARRLLELMDLFVLPSRSEGMSLALLEAMAAGVPVMVTDVGANREIIANGAAGVLLPEDESQWPVRICMELEQGNHGVSARTAQVAFAQARVMEHYALALGLEKYESIYCALGKT